MPLGGEGDCPALSRSRSTLGSVGSPDRPSFFVPRTLGDAEGAERIWQKTRTLAEETHPGVLSDRRVFRLGYMHNGEHEEAQVGVPHPYGYETTWDAPEPPPYREEVMVILEREGGSYLVCTWSRGVNNRGEPILVGAGEVYEVVYFAGYGPED